MLHGRSSQATIVKINAIRSNCRGPLVLQFMTVYHLMFYKAKNTDVAV